MKKKNYVQPYITMEQDESAQMICASQGVSSNVGIGYGGIDEDGSKAPECRRQYTWDEDTE